jgi:hypothetical protein
MKRAIVKRKVNVRKVSVDFRLNLLTTRPMEFLNKVDALCRRYAVNDDEVYKKAYDTEWELESQ